MKELSLFEKVAFSAPRDVEVKKENEIFHEK